MARQSQPPIITDPLPPPMTHYTIGESEPLLGRDRLTQVRREAESGEPEDAGVPLWSNLTSGTALLAQIGGIALVVNVWTSVFRNKLLLFSGHPVSIPLCVFQVDARR